MEPPPRVLGEGSAPELEVSVALSMKPSPGGCISDWWLELHSGLLRQESVVMVTLLLAG